MKEDTSVLAGLLSTTGQLESLESLDAAFTTNIGSFRQRHVSDSVSLMGIFYCRSLGVRAVIVSEIIVKLRLIFEENFLIP